jgi:archaellum component FlaC
MTIDERLEKLTGRHEALTLTVEVLTADIHTLQDAAQKLAVASEAQRISIDVLADVAHSHQQRLDRLEGR